MGKLTPAAWEQLRDWEWKRFNAKRRRRLKRTDFTIIASNCNGTMIYHDLGLPFLSPTINLTVSMTDFVRLAENLAAYMARPLVPAPAREDAPWPVARLGDIQVNLVHYQTCEEAETLWNRRKERMNWEKLFFIGAEKGGCPYDTLQRFDRLPYPKVMFTYNDYPEFSSCFRLSGFESLGQMGVTTDFQPGRWKRRYIDQFDYVASPNGQWPEGPEIGA